MLVSTYPVGNTSYQPQFIAQGPDGSGGRCIWWTEQGNGSTAAVCKIVNGTITRYTTGLTSSARPYGICEGSDGRMWLAQYARSYVAAIDPATTTITEYSTGYNAYGVCSGPDGNVWVATNSAAILKVTTAGTVSTYTTGITAGELTGIASDGTDLWFTNDTGNKLGKITTAGTVSEYSTSQSQARPTQIVKGADGNMWFTERASSATAKICKVTTSGTVGTVTGYTTGLTGTQPYGICAGSDGNVWFTEYGGGTGTYIGFIDTSGNIKDFTVPNAVGPTGITQGPDNAIWVSNIGGTDAITRVGYKENMGRPRLATQQSIARAAGY